METQQIDLSNLDTAELERLLAEKKKQATAAQRKREKDYITKRDTFITTMIQQAAEASALLRDLKQEVVIRGNELHDLMFEVFSKEPRELQSFSLITEDGMYRVEIDRAPIMGLNETAEVHIETCKQVMTDTFAGRNKGMWNMINRIMMKNSKGDYDPKMLVKLRAESETVNDKRFDDALDGLAKATYQTGTATYARFYRKNVGTNSWEMIPMQFSSM